MVFSLASRGLGIANPIRRAREWRLTGPGGFEILEGRRDERQLGVGNGLVFAVAPDDRERLAPVTLTGEKPIAQLVVDRAATEPLLIQPSR